MNLTNKNWRKLFEKYNIYNALETNGYFEITSKQINEFRQARLMTKFDHKCNLPKIFKDDNLSVLPVENGKYIISNFEAYKDIEEIDLEPTIINPKIYVDSIEHNDIYSEAIALNYALLSGILPDFFDDDSVYHTLSGRMRSSKFDFFINNTKQNKIINIDVNNTQVEIDGGYETKNNLYIVEAKNSLPSDFLVRQLYYPFRLWHDKLYNLKSTKKVIPIFMTYSNDIWSIYEYDFIDPKNYNSLELVKQKNYKIASPEIHKTDLILLIQKIKLSCEPENIPYPQANSFKRVINLLEILSTNKFTKEDIFLNFNTDSLVTRQIDYYLNAVKYLGLLDETYEDGEKFYTLNNLGNKIMNLDYKNKYLGIISCLINKPSFYQSVKFYLTNSTIPDKDKIVEFMYKSNISSIKKESTYFRRASTVYAWLQWIDSMIQKN